MIEEDEFAAWQEADLLATRAAQLARPRAVVEQGPRLELLCFTLAQERYAAEIAYVAEVHPFRNLTPIPCTPPHVMGAVSWRGRVVAVVDVKRFFGLQQRGLVDLNRIVVLKHGDMEFGLMADEILGLSRIPEQHIVPPPATFGGIHRDYLRGIGPDSLVVLDARALLTDRRLVVRESVGDA